MPILDRDLFSTDAGWTEDPDPPSSGSYTVTGGAGVYTAGGGGLDTNTAIRTAGVDTVAAGYTFQESFTMSSGTNNNWMIGIVNAFGAAYQGSYSAYVNNAAKRLFAYDVSGAVNVTGTPDVSENVVHTYKFTITAGGVAEFRYDGNLVHTSVNFNTLLGDTIYFLRGNVDTVGAGGTLTVDNFVATDGTYTPPDPTDLDGEATGETTATITWTDVATTVNADSIRIERSLSSGGGFSEIDSVNIGVETFDDTGLDPDTTYYYRIRARVSVTDYSGATVYNSGYSAEFDITTDAPPVASGSDGEDMLAMGEL